MEGFEGPKFSNVTSIMKKKRSTKSRRARPDSQFIIERQDTSSLSSTPSSETRNCYAPRIAPLSSMEGVSSSKKIRKEEKYGDLSGLYGSGSHTKRISENVLALANLKSSSSGSAGGNSNTFSENKLKKVKLKVGGVTRTFRPKASAVIENSGYESKIAYKKESIIQDDSDDDSTPAVKGDLSPFEGQTSLSEPVRKSKRVPKKRVFDNEPGERNKVDETRNLEKQKFSKITTVNKISDLVDDVHTSMKKKNISRASRSKRVSYTVDEDYNSSITDSKKKSRMGKELNDLEFIDEDEVEVGLESKLNTKKRKERREFTDTNEARIEPLTARQRALQSGKGSSGGDSLIEFPDGLPPAPPRKQKEKLTEKEQQARKAEAAQRRRMQVEKANRESEAEAIRKILGQDSSRRKKEEKLRKERDELAQKKAAEALVLAPNSIRCVIGPTRTIVTFGEDVDFLSIFPPKPLSYPPPREKCAAPLCPNAYKYRDSKLNLPLCSLQCYKAVQGSSHTISTT